MKPTVRSMVSSAFDFPLEVPALDDQVRALELFHGPSLAFKDFGARFMARCLAEFHDGGPMTILTATSGDTGAAVAHAYYNQPGINVVILYPKGKISPLQEKLFCTLGGNITTIAVDSDFDTCQHWLKQCFEDEQLKDDLGLNSANSINMARLLAQVCYYFEAGAAVSSVEDMVLSVPSGNFGNLTAGLIARRIGLPYKRIIAATNANDTVPRFLASGRWDPYPTVPTITNAMDVSLPNNFPRVLELGGSHGLPLETMLSSLALDDDETRDAMRELYSRGYLADPAHGPGLGGSGPVSGGRRRRCISVYGPSGQVPGSAGGDAGYRSPVAARTGSSKRQTGTVQHHCRGFRVTEAGACTAEESHISRNSPMEHLMRRLHRLNSPECFRRSFPCWL